MKHHNWEAEDERSNGPKEFEGLNRKNLAPVLNENPVLIRNKKFAINERRTAGNNDVIAFEICTP